MCLECHSRLTNDQVLQQLLDTQKLPEFNEWNTTSVSHCLLACAGANGAEARELGFSIMDDFLKWYTNTKKDRYFPECGIEPMPSTQELKNVLNWMKSYDYKTNCLERFITNFPNIPEDISETWNGFYERNTSRDDFITTDKMLIILAICVVAVLVLFVMC
jgi:hypothetical protein